MDCKELYAQKLMTAAQAAALVKSGDWVDYGWAVNTPVAVDAELAKRLPELEGVNFRGGILMWVPEIFQIDDPAAHMTWNSWHMGGIERKAIAQGFSFYSPIRYSELPRYYRESSDPVDVAVFQVTPMDEHGYFNFGPSASHLGAVCEKAKKIIVEVNENMPFAYGYSNEINIKDVDYIVEGENLPLAELKMKAPSAEDQEIANHVVQNLESGSTIQIGIGGLPSSVGSLLANSDINELNIHTEMFVDAYLDLYAAGKIVNKINLPMNHGRAVYSFAAGSKRLYDFINNNPTCCCAPVEWVNNCTNIAEINKFVSINSCIAVDIYGQVCAETAGYKQVSGTGGQLDFVIGAYRSNGGKSFLCLPSTRTLKDGRRVSLITPILPPGSVVTTPRSCTGFIVTEYGAVNLKGKSTWERAEMLIGISHPDFRDDMIREAEKMGIWSNTSKREY